MDKQSYINSIFGCDNQKYSIVYHNGQEENMVCRCGNPYFYRLVNNLIVCTECFIEYSCNEFNCYIKRLIKSEEKNNEK